jgi:ABC-2 type transport system permease protein
VKGTFLLFKLAVKRARTLLIATGLLLAAFQVLLVLIAGSIKPSEFDQLAALLPPFVRAIMGAAVASIMSFAGIVSIGYFDLAIVIALLALTIAMATLPASEIENGVVDLILARPLPRHWVITRTIAVVLFSIMLMLAMMIAGTWIGLYTLAPENAIWPTPYMIGMMALNLGMLMVCWSGVAMALGSVYRRSVASATTGLLALLTLLLNIVEGIWTPAEHVGWLSPFHYFVPFDIVMGHELYLENVVVLWAVGMTGYIVAYFLFSRRDISR